MVREVALRDVMSATFFKLPYFTNSPLFSKLPCRSTFYYHFMPCEPAKISRDWTGVTCPHTPLELRPSLVALFNI